MGFLGWRDDPPHLLGFFDMGIAPLLKRVPVHKGGAADFLVVTVYIARRFRVVAFEGARGNCWLIT